MNFGLYKSYIDNPERFFAPARPIISEGRPFNRMRGYHASSPASPPTARKPQVINGPAYTKAYYDLDFNSERINAGAKDALTPTFEDSQYESWWLQHKRWKARQRGKLTTRFSAETSPTQRRNACLNLVDLSFPEIRPKANYNRATSRTGTAGYGEDAAVMQTGDSKNKSAENSRPLEKKAKGEQKEAERNFTYIQPKLKTYLEYLKTPADRPRTHASSVPAASAIPHDCSDKPSSRVTQDHRKKALSLLIEGDEESRDSPGKSELEQTLSISSKTMNFKPIVVKSVKRRPRPRVKRFEATRGLYDTPSSIPSPLMTSRPL
jgi:hypothetical protein